MYFLWGFKLSFRLQTRQTVHVFLNNLIEQLYIFDFCENKYPDMYGLHGVVPEMFLKAEWIMCILVLILLQN